MSRLSIATVAVAFSLIAAPLAFAQTTAELQAQIVQLMARLQTLQQQLGTAGVPGGVVPVGPSGPILCPHVGRSLSIGSTGDDVARLQRFLAVDRSVYPEAQVTGFYGPLTEAAVKRWQAKFFIVSDGTPATTGFGVVGPRTAAILALQCPGETYGGGGPVSTTSHVGGFIKVTPISGPAPLSVVVDATVHTTNSCTGATYEIDFGDNTAPLPIVVPQNRCAEMRQTFNHTYLNPGTYTVTLRSGVHQTSATVVVGAPLPPPASDSFTASATSGTVPATITFSGIANAAGSCNIGSYTITFGDGQSTTVPLNTQTCSGSAYTATHTYTTAGSFTASFIRGVEGSGNVVATRSITIANPPSTGTGTFSVTAGIDPSNPKRVRVRFEISSSCAAYDLEWGDSSAHEAQSEGSCAANVITKEFFHTYGPTGSYTITLKRGATLSAVQTAGVTITQ